MTKSKQTRLTPKMPKIVKTAEMSQKWANNLIVLKRRGSGPKRSKDPISLRKRLHHANTSIVSASSQFVHYSMGKKNLMSQMLKIL